MTSETALGEIHGTAALLKLNFTFDGSAQNQSFCFIFILKEIQEKINIKLFRQRYCFWTKGNIYPTCCNWIQFLLGNKSEGNLDL